MGFIHGLKCICVNFLNRISLGVFAIWLQISCMSFAKLLAQNLPGDTLTSSDITAILHPIAYSYSYAIILFFLLGYRMCNNLHSCEQK